MLIKEFSAKFKTAGDQDGDGGELAEGEFIAYPSTFTRQPDSYGDVVAPGAFSDTIADWKARGETMPVLYGHRMDDPDYFIGGVKDMGEDEHGWWIHGAFDMESPKAARVYELIKSKRLNQLSFAFDVEDEGQVELDDGTKANELRKLKVYEASFVPVGANQDTGIAAIKSCDPLTKARRVLSAKNAETLADIAEQMIVQAKRIKDFLSEATARSDEEENDDAKASAEGKAKNEEPDEAKSEEPHLKADQLALSSMIAQLGQEGDSE